MRVGSITILFMLFSAFFLVSCGDDKNSGESSQQQNDGTVLNRTAVRNHDFVFGVPSYKKTPLAPVNIQRWAMISTGQTECYDHVKRIPCPQFGEKYFGQDGQAQMGTRSLTLASNNETVVDSVARLVWTRKIKENVTWYEAKAYCDSLRLNNKKTWRLPTTSELRSIVNYGKVGPAIDDVFYKIGIAEDTELKNSLSNWFWATKHVHFDSENGTDLASSWIVNFYDGFVEYTSRYNTYNVRCVTEEF